MEYNLDLQKAKCKVYPILSSNYSARDDDRVLLTSIWIEEMKLLNDSDFMGNFLKGNLSNPETITRSRRKLQQENIDLRGDKFDERHKLEGYICQQLTFFDRW